MAVDVHALCLPQTRASGKQKNSDIAVCGKISMTPTLDLKHYFAGSLLFDSCITVFEPCDSVTGDNYEIYFFALSSCIFSRAFAFRSSEYGADMR